MSVAFRNWQEGDFAGARWQDGRRPYMDAFLAECAGSAFAVTMTYDGRPVGALGYLACNPYWWLAALGMVEGAPRILWRHMIGHAKAWIAHAVRDLGVRMIETRIVATFAEGHALAARLGFTFCGWEQGADGSGVLMARYITGGPLGLPAINGEVAAAMQAAHEAMLRVYAPAALRVVRRIGESREAAHG